MKTLLEIKEFEVLVGTDVRQVIEEALIIARNKRCIVNFNFNGWHARIFSFESAISRGHFIWGIELI